LRSLAVPPELHLPVAVAPCAPQPTLLCGPARPSLAPHHPLSVPGGSCPSSPTSGRSPTGQGSPTPSRPGARAFPLACTPRRSSCPIKPAALRRTAFHPNP
jgi:hypothetical protein